MITLSVRFALDWQTGTTCLVWQNSGGPCTIATGDHDKNSMESPKQRIKSLTDENYVTFAFSRFLLFGKTNLFSGIKARNRRHLLCRICLLSALFVWISGCATRQVSDSLQGSTAQRLVTYSLERFVVELLDQPELAQIEGKSVALKVMFLHDHTLLPYATELLRQRLAARSGSLLVTDEHEADLQVTVFFNSIGTDYDSFGLSLPTFGLASTPDAKINVLAVDMFHGVTEGYAVLQPQNDTGQLRTRRLLVRVRADNVSTPVVDFPVNQLD